MMTIGCISACMLVVAATALVCVMSPAKAVAQNNNAPHPAAPKTNLEPVFIFIPP
jgi:hypothetical protein